MKYRSRIEPFLLLLIEFFFSILVFVPFYKGHWQLLLPALSSFLILYFIYAGLKYLNPKMKLSAFYIATIVVGGISCFWFNPFFSLFYLLFIGWRMIKVVTRETINQSWTLFLASALIGSSYYVYVRGFDPNFPKPLSLFLLIGIQLFLTLLLNLFQQDQHKSTQSGFTFISFIAVIGGTILTGGMIILLLPIVRNILIYLVAGIGYIIIMLITPVFNLLQHHKKTYKEIETSLNQDNDFSKFLHTPAHAQGLSETTWLFLMIIAFIILSAFIIFFLRRSRLDVTISEKMNMESHALSPNDPLLKRRKKPKPPKEEIRLLLFQFQSKMTKLGLGRYKYETLTEWFNRLPIDQNEKVRLFYEKYRYGEQPLNDAEKLIYREELRMLTEEIEKWIKNKKKALN